MKNEIQCPTCHRILRSSATYTVMENGQKSKIKVYFCSNCNKSFSDSIQSPETRCFYVPGKGVIHNIEYKNSHNMMSIEKSEPLKPTGTRVSPSNKLRCQVYHQKDIVTYCNRCRGEIVMESLAFRKSKGVAKLHKVPYCEKCDLFFLTNEQLSKCVENIECIKKSTQNANRQAVHLETAKSKIRNVPKTLSKSNVKTEERNRLSIEFKDFIVRQTIIQCENKGHHIEDILGEISYIDRYGVEKKMLIPAGFCKKCKTFFILENKYQQIKKKGLLLCRICDDKTYRRHGKIGYGELQDESILKQYGYSVSSTNPLSERKRQAVLALLIDNQILTKVKIINHLEWNIRMREPITEKDYSMAIAKWEDDIKFVERYKQGNYTKLGVKSITRK